VLLARVRLGEGCEVGPCAVVGPEVSLGPGCAVGAHAVVTGPATFGPRNRFFPHAAVGGEPQDLKYRGEPTRLEVGAGNVFREFVTVGRGTEQGGGVTRIGSRCLFMATTHVAHDCILGDGVIMANGASLGGHVLIEDGAVLGAMCGVHQFGRVGRLAMVGAGAMAARDVAPYTLVQGDRARLFGLNLVGLRRAGFTPETIRRLKEVYRVLFTGRRALRDAVAEARARFRGDPHVDHLLDFVVSGERGVVR